MKKESRMNLWLILILLAIGGLWLLNRPPALGQWREQSANQPREMVEATFGAAPQALQQRLLGALNTDAMTWTDAGRAENETRKNATHGYYAPPESRKENKFPATALLHLYHAQDNRKSDYTTDGFRPMKNASGMVVGDSSDAAVDPGSANGSTADPALRDYLATAREARMDDLMLLPIDGLNGYHKADYRKKDETLPYNADYILSLSPADGGTRLHVIGVRSRVVVGKRLAFTQAGLPSLPYWTDDIREVTPSVADKKALLAELQAMAGR